MGILNQAIDLLTDRERKNAKDGKYSAGQDLFLAVRELCA